MLHNKIQYILDNYLKPKVYLTPNDPMILNILSKLSQIACFYRIRFNDKWINYFPWIYCISFLNAGGWKDRPNDIIEELTIDIDEKFKNKIDAFHEKQIHDRLEKVKDMKWAEKTAYLKENTIDKIKTWFSNWTIQWFHKSRLQMFKAWFGNSHFYETEFIDYITNSTDEEEKILSYIKKAYQHWFSSTPTIKTERTLEDIKWVPMTMFSHSAIWDILNDKKIMSKFNSFWKRWFNRRCIISYIDKFKTPLFTYEEKLWFIEKAKSGFYKCKEIFNDFDEVVSKMDFGLNTYWKTLTISDQAFMLFSEYEDKCINLQNDIKNEILIEEIADRKHRAMQIAWLYALLDWTYEVSTNNLEMAICLIEYYSGQFHKFFKKKEDIDNVDSEVFNTLYEYILLNPWTSIRKIFYGKLSWFPKEYNKFKPMLSFIIKDLNWYCNELWVSFVENVDKNGFSSYFIETLKNDTIINEDILVNYSSTKQNYFNWETYIKSIADWFEDKQCLFKDFFAIPFKNECYSAIQYNTWHRLWVNSKWKMNLLILDIDNDFKKWVFRHGLMTIEEAKIKLKNYKCLIFPTKSHQKWKPETKTKESQPIVDRFRILLPFNSCIEDNSLKAIFNWIIKDFDLKWVDEWATDLARYFYPSTHWNDLIWYSEWNKIIDWEKYKLEDQNVVSKSNYENIKNSWFNFWPYESLSVWQKAIPITCPYHKDDTMSAFVKRSDKEKSYWEMFMHCKSCEKTWW